VAPTVPVALHASNINLPKINFKFFPKTHPSHGMKIQLECSVFPLLHFPSSAFPTVLPCGRPVPRNLQSSRLPASCQRRRDTILLSRTVPRPHCSDSYSSASHRRGPGSVPCVRVLGSYPVSVIPLCCTLIFVSGEAWEVSRKKCSLVNRAAWDKKKYFQFLGVQRFELVVHFSTAVTERDCKFACLVSRCEWLAVPFCSQF